MGNYTQLPPATTRRVGVTDDEGPMTKPTSSSRHTEMPMTSDTSGNGRPSPTSGDHDHERWPDEAQSGFSDHHDNGNGADRAVGPRATGLGPMGAPGSRMGATNGSHHATTFSDPIFLDDADDHITNDPDPGRR